MLNEAKIAKITKLWEKGNHKRGYVNVLNLLATKIERHKTGTFSRVEIGDMIISNAEARRLEWSKCYYDYKAKEFVFDSGCEDYEDQILKFFE